MNTDEKKTVVDEQYVLDVLDHCGGEGNVCASCQLGEKTLDACKAVYRTAVQLLREKQKKLETAEEALRDASVIIQEKQVELDTALDDMRTIAQAYNTCAGCAARCDEDELPEDAPDCSTCKNQSNWRWTGA